MADSTIQKAKSAVAKIAKHFTDGALMVMSDTARGDVEVVPTGSLGLDRALGVGGIPRGRVVEVYGPEASGKTTLTLNLVAQAQALGLLVAFVDAEHALDRAYAEQVGVDVDSLVLAQPDSGEDALEICERLVRDAEVGLVVVDSVAALVPRAEIEGEMGDQHVGLQARLMSQALRKLTPVVHKQGSTVVFINQIRMKIGTMGFGSPETTSGGRALRFYSSVRLDIRRIASLKNKEHVYGSRVRVKVVKNKVAPPHTKTEFDIVFGEGIDRLGEVIDKGLEIGCCSKSGPWHAYGDTRLGQGRQKSIEYLREHPEVAAGIEREIRDAWRREDEEAQQARAARFSKRGAGSPAGIQTEEPPLLVAAL